MIGWQLRSVMLDTLSSTQAQASAPYVQVRLNDFVSGKRIFALQSFVSEVRQFVFEVSVNF